MSTIILTLDEIEEAYNYIDHIHDGIIDELASLEGDNWGCPVEGSEEIRAILRRLSDAGFTFLDDLNTLIEKKKNDIR